MLDELSPEQARAMIVLYHTWLEDPPLFFLGYKIFTWISPILTAWAHIKDIFLVVNCGQLIWVAGDIRNNKVKSILIFWLLALLASVPEPVAALAGAASSLQSSR
jgi:hypothetical protein